MLFPEPIRSKKLQSLEDVKKFSEYVVNPDSRKMVKVFWQNNGQIAFTDDFGQIFVTPYRTEVREILSQNGYIERDIPVPYSSGSSDIPVHYTWLKKIAERENWAETHEKAYQHAQKNDIKPVVLEFSSKQLRYREITECYSDKNTSLEYRPMVEMYLMNGTEENVATYIIIDDLTLLVCDEYGRTFHITAHQKATFNNVVNSLIDAGYYHNPHPEAYVVPAQRKFFLPPSDLD